MTDTDQLAAASIMNVVSNGYCIGCGGCAVMSDGISMEIGRDGQYVPRIDNIAALSERAGSTCPFTNEGPDESALGKALY